MTRCRTFFCVLISLLVLSCFGQVVGADFKLETPDQRSGLPYTRSGKAAAINKIKDAIAVFAGSRYGWVYGKKVRLDQADVLGGEAFCRDRVIYVPEEFARALLIKNIAMDTAPDYLASRWVYTIADVPYTLPKQVETMKVKGKRYVDLAGLAKAKKFKTHQNDRGLIVINKTNISFDQDAEVILDGVISLFDTPDKLADSDVAMQYIPLLKRQGRWTDFVKATDEQLKLLEGPETDWPLVSKEDYDLSGFNHELLGSTVPEPGVYPRILFSPEDLPMLRERLAQNKFMQKALIETEIFFKHSWWDQSTSDGKVFKRLVEGGPLTRSDMRESDLAKPLPRAPWVLKGQKPGIYNSHYNYVTHCLSSMAFYALINDDDDLGRQVATAIINYSHLAEALIDDANRWSDSEFGTDHDLAYGGETAWRMMHAIASAMDVPFLLDFAGKWMDDGERDRMRRWIAKATYGRAESHASGSMRWQDNNHCTWHTTISLAVMAIEGLEGCDPEIYARGLRSAQAFCEFGIDKHGVVYESNGKSGAGFHFHILNMIAMARRGDNFWGHPHWRRLMEGQMQCTSPNGTVTVTSGTYSGGKINPHIISYFKAFYPESKEADFMLTQTYPDVDYSKFDAAAYRKELENPKNRNRMRLPILNFMDLPGIYNTDWTPTTRDEVKVKRDFNDTTYGLLSSVSDDSTDAVWMLMQVRDNHYIGAGHHHADPGLFYFSGEGVNWITESPITTYYHGFLHNNVLIDGVSMPDGPAARGRYLGAQIQDGGALASADLTYAYSWRWNTQIVLWDEGGWWGAEAPATQHYEFEPDPEIIKIFKGTQRYKMRIWWPSYNFSNWLPTVRAPYNSVEYAYRTAGLIRGDHPYGILVDDVKKDGEIHLYQWTAATGRGVWKSDLTHTLDLPENQMLLGHSPFQVGSPAHHAVSQNAIRSKEGDAQMLICVLNHQTTGDPDRPLITVRTEEGPFDRRWKRQQFYDRININHSGDMGQFRVVLIPFRKGQALPLITYNETLGTAVIAWADQVDRLELAKRKNGKTKTTIKREGKILVSW